MLTSQLQRGSLGGRHVRLQQTVLLPPTSSLAQVEGAFKLALPLGHKFQDFIACVSSDDHFSSLVREGKLLFLFVPVECENCISDNLRRGHEVLATRVEISRGRKRFSGAINVIGRRRGYLYLLWRLVFVDVIESIFSLCLHCFWPHAVAR